MRAIHLELVPRCVHRGVIDGKGYGIATYHAGVGHAQEVFARTERPATEQEVGEHQLILHPAERMIPVLKPSSNRQTIKKEKIKKRNTSRTVEGSRDRTFRIR